MFQMAILLAYQLLPGRVVQSDTATLAHVRAAVKSLNDRKAAFVRFEQTLKPSDAATWQRLLGKVRANSKDYAALSFALAYYGIDYDRNLARLLRPYRIYSRDSARWAKEYPMRETSTLVDLDFAWFSMNLLYLKHHDLKSLGAWLDLRLDGAYAEGSLQALAELWQRHETDMLRAANSSDRIAHLAIVLVGDPQNGDATGNRNPLRTLLADLQRRAHGRDPRVALSARRLIPAIQAHLR